MEKLWAGRINKQSDSRADDFNSSVRFDAIMYKHDIAGSIAHAEMLAKQDIISSVDAQIIIVGLSSILNDIDSGALEIDQTAEDIHMFIEAELTKRVGDVGKKLHTARSRNDQVAVDVRMYLRDKCKELIAKIKALIEVIKNQAEKNQDAIVPG